MEQSDENKKAKILYVDDEPGNLVVFNQAFKRFFDVSTAESGEEALELMKTQTFDIVISDQRMPNMSGVELFEKIRAEELESVRILLTGYTDMQSIIDAINRGQIYYYSTKPWGLEELKMVLLKALEFAEVSRKQKKIAEDLANYIKELDKLNQMSSEVIHKIRI